MYKILVSIFVLFSLLFITSCGTKTIGIVEMRSYYSDTYTCVSNLAVKPPYNIIIPDINDIPKPKLEIIPDTDKVVKDGKEYRGYYEPNLVILPEDSDENTIKHEFVHHFVYHSTEHGTDPFHVLAEWYLNCSGLIVE